jgi:Phage integrase family
MWNEGRRRAAKTSWKDDEYLLTTVRNHRTASGHRLGDYPLTAITEDELESVNAWAASRKAWETAVLKAHGVKPVWIGGKLSADCRAHLRRIDLRFHDLRREAGSRWHEGGFQLHEVRDLLGHANVSQTDTYLSAKIPGLRESMKRFDAARGKAVAKPAVIEQRPLGHDETEESQKDRLH